MGCAPSRPTTSIRVEQRQDLLEEDWATPDPNWLVNDSESRKEVFEIPDEDGDTDKSSDSFLQESMKSHHSQLSTNSSGSWDSGVYELDDEYSHIITENSDPEKVRIVDREFVPRDDLELILEGKACPRKLSSMDRDRLEQQTILEMLRDEGLVVRPPAKAVGGIKFEVVSAQQFPPNGSPFLRRLPPLEIEKKHKKKKKVLTYEEIQKKLAEAEERRKKKHEEKMSKLTTKDVHQLQVIAEQELEKNRERYEKKLQEKAKSREQHLNEVQERLKAREEHAKRVRKRKEMIANGFNYVIPKQTERNPKELHKNINLSGNMQK